METPEGLSGNALMLWNDTTRDYDLETHELITLEQACRELMLVERMQRDIDALTELMDEGSMGQRVVHDLIKEIRQHRAKLEQTLKALALPVDGDTPAGNRATKARAAANRRWGKPS